MKDYRRVKVLSLFLQRLPGADTKPPACYKVANILFGKPVWETGAFSALIGPIIAIMWSEIAEKKKRRKSSQEALR